LEEVAAIQGHRIPGPTLSERAAELNDINPNADALELDRLTLRP